MKLFVRRCLSVFALLLTLANVQCGSSPEEPQPVEAKPGMVFSAQPASIVSGSSSTLTWNASNASSVSIAGVGTFGTKGSLVVKPTATTTYTATAFGLNGSATSSAMVSVSQPSSPPSTPAPTIVFSANPSTIAQGGSSALSWNTTNSSSVEIAGLGTFAVNGSVTVTPSVTTNYTATVSGSGGTTTSSTTVTVTPASGVPVFDHVVLLLEENHSYSSVIGSSSMPYLNTLVSEYGLATAYYANTHPSIGNYFMLTTGQIITNNDSYNKTVNVDNMVRHFISEAKTWKAYAESLPSVGYTGWDVYPYVKHHNPFAYFSDVVNSSEKNNLVPFSQFSSDLKNNHLPQFSYIVPNMLDDGHDGSLATADNWLETNIAPLISNASFQQSGLLIIVFDESTSSDSQHGGGHVAMLVISPEAKKDYKSTTFYQHQSTCRLVLQALGLTSFPNSCSSAPQMSDFF
ncbi:MAG TPA: alkaline phosphatase family protein [Terriglobales bacterium]|nr:alkaline phosphatase family protein [Terriglobales bacterium]